MKVLISLDYEWHGLVIFSTLDHILQSLSNDTCTFCVILIASYVVPHYCMSPHRHKGGPYGLASIAPMHSESMVIYTLSENPS